MEIYCPRCNERKKYVSVCSGCMERDEAERDRLKEQIKNLEQDIQEAECAITGSCSKYDGQGNPEEDCYWMRKADAMQAVVEAAEKSARTHRAAIRHRNDDDSIALKVIAEMALADLEKTLDSPNLFREATKKAAGDEAERDALKARCQAMEAVVEAARWHKETKQYYVHCMKSSSRQYRNLVSFKELCVTARQAQEDFILVLDELEGVNQ